MGGWRERAAANDGIVPDNTGPDGVVGSLLGGRWYGGHHGWSWPHGWYSVGSAAAVAALAAAAATGDDGYLDLVRPALDALIEHGKVMAFAESDSSLTSKWYPQLAEAAATPTLLVPFRHSDRGWFDGPTGVRHLVQGEPDPDWLGRPDVRRGLRAVADAGLVYDLLTRPRQLPAAREAARALPGLTFVLDHLSKPPIASGALQPWATLVRELAALPNVSCKLSGMVTEAGPRWTVAGLRPYAEVILDAFGPSRVMLGSDWPVCLLAASYVQVVSAAQELAAGLDQDEQADVFGGTAARVYRLPAADHEGPPGLRRMQTAVA